MPSGAARRRPGRADPAAARRADAPTEIARAFLVPEATVGQRIARAKRTLAAQQVAFELPPPAEAAERLASVLEVIYLIFNEGYAATAGDDWMRPDLCEEALRLGRVLAGAGAARARGARAGGPDGAAGVPDPGPHRAGRAADPAAGPGPPAVGPVADPARAGRARARARHLGGGPYTLQAAIAACHARAASAADTDWDADRGAVRGYWPHVWPSPVVELNRAVAVGLAVGPDRGLELLAPLAAEPALAGYPQLPAVHADLLALAGRPAEAAEQFERAAELSGNDDERSIFLRRADECRRAADSTPRSG